MTTATFVPTLLQQLEAACSGGPLHNPATDAWVSERRAAYDAEMRRELSGLTGKDQRASLDAVSHAVGDYATGHWHGIYFAVEFVHGEAQVIAESVAIDDVEEFVANHGLPATHQRARDLFDLGNCSGGSRAIDDALDGWAQEDPRIGDEPEGY